MAEHELSILIRAKGAVQAARDIGKVDSSLGRLGSTAKRGVATAGRNLAVIGAGVAIGITAGVKSGIESLADLEDATTSVQGAITTLGLTGQVSATQVATWANEIETKIGAAFDDKEIVAATAGLIRYGKVVPQNLQPAMEVMTDLAAKTGSVEAAGSLLSKALADPAKAAGKLARVGVILTKEQQKQIKVMVKAGDTAGAQAVLLDALAESTEGAAAASQGPYRRSLSVLADVTEDAQRALGEGFLPVITKVSELLQGELAKPGTINNIREFGKGLASGLDDLIEIARSLPWATIGTSLQVAGAGAKAVLGAFASLPSWVQTAVLTSWGLNKLTGGALGSIVGEIGKGLIKGVLGMNAGVVNARAGVVNVAGGVGGGLPGAAPGGGGTLAQAAKVTIVGSVIVAGLAAWAASMDSFIQKNQEKKDKGLTTAEIAAVGYYAADKQTQSLIYKRLGYIPKKSDADTGNAKLQGKIASTNDSLVQLKKEQAEARRITSQKLSENRTAQIETKRETGRGASLMSSTTRSSSATNAATISSAIRANRPTITTKVDVHVTAASVSKSVTVQERYGSGNGSAGTGHAIGTGPLP